MQILVKQFIVDPESKITDCILDPPFAFLQNLVEELSNFRPESRRSTQVFVGAQLLENRSTEDVERFLSSIRFENREKLKVLGLETSIS